MNNDAQEDVCFFPMLPIHLLQKMRHFRYLKEIKCIYVSMYVEPVKQTTTIRLQITTCVLLRHIKIITLYCTKYNYGIDIIIEYIRYRNVIIIALAMTYK
jgi:hypothetical protein